jgi:hypothetical protein
MTDGPPVSGSQPASELDPQAPPTPVEPARQDEVDFFDTIRGSIITSIPALSSLTFVIVSVKVFRASGMEATTTVAVVSTADPIALLKGVLLTLLPGFLTAVVATSLWWWADAIPKSPVLTSRTATTVGLGSPQAVFAWAMVVTAFYTISWPLFLLLLAPTVVVTLGLIRGMRGQELTVERLTRLRMWLKGVGGTTAVLAVAFLTLAPSVWLPLRTISVVSGHVVTANGRPLPDKFAAYVLDHDDDSYNLLLAKPRAVVLVSAHDIKPLPPLCVTPAAKTRFFYLRPSQLVHIDPDNHSPYPQCPQLDYQTIFGN